MIAEDWIFVPHGVPAYEQTIAYLMIALGFWTLGFSTPAFDRTGEVQIFPPTPTTEQEIVLVVGGTWTDSCVPNLVEVRISGKHVVIATESPGQGCVQGARAWLLNVPLGRLPTSQHAGTVTQWATSPGKSFSRRCGCARGAAEVAL